MLYNGPTCLDRKAAFLSCFFLDIAVPMEVNWLSTNQALREIRERFAFIT